MPSVFRALFLCAFMIVLSGSWGAGSAHATTFSSWSPDRPAQIVDARGTVFQTGVAVADAGSDDAEQVAGRAGEVPVNGGGKVVKGLLGALFHVVAGVYLFIALVAMVNTLLEARYNKVSSILGSIAGCALCLFWLPIVGTFYLVQQLEIANRETRGSGSKHDPDALRRFDPRFAVVNAGLGWWRAAVDVSDNR